MRFLLALLPACAFGCAQPPTKELDMAAARVEKARLASAPIFAPELFAEAEASLAEARRLVASGSDRLGAIRAAARATIRADEASVHASSESAVARQRLDRLLFELDSLLDMAGKRGAGAEAAEELASLRKRSGSVRELARTGDVLGALKDGADLKPELLEFEKRFRREVPQSPTH